MRIIFLVILSIFLCSCSLREEKIEEIAVQELPESEENGSAESQHQKILQKISEQQTKEAEKELPEEEQTNIGQEPKNQIQEPKTNIPEEKKDFLGMDIDLVHTSGKQYKLIAKSLPSQTEKVEILTCSSNYSGTYKADWGKVANVPKNAQAFIYKIAPAYNNFCDLPYQLQLTGAYGTKKLELDLHLRFIDQFNNPKAGQRKRWPMNSVHINTFTLLKDGEIAVDKNLLFDTYFSNYTEMVVSRVKNYQTYKYYKGLLIGDGNIISYRYPRGDTRQLFFYDRMPVDFDTFVYLKWSYFQDKNGYYQLSNKNDRKLIILGSEEKDFEPLSEKVYRYGDTFFYGEKELTGIDAETFRVFDYEHRKIYNEKNAQVSAFAKDKDRVYFQIETGYANAKEQQYFSAMRADFDTLQLYSLDLTGTEVFMDKNTIFFPSGKVLKKKFDTETFTKMGEGNIFSDIHGVYFLLNERIIPFDKETFKQYGTGILQDKDKSYIGTEKLNFPPGYLKIITEKPVIAVEIQGKYYHNCVDTITPDSIKDVLQLHNKQIEKSTAWKEFQPNLLNDDPKVLYKNVCN